MNNMIPNKAVEKAEVGGFRNAYSEDNRWQAIALDPTFWQSLGKALGWLEWTCKDDGCYSTNDTGKVTGPVIKTWRFKAECFYDLILMGGDTEAFWNELLKEGWSVVESDRTD